MPCAVLAVGNCSADQWALAAMIEQEFEARALSADDWEEAAEILARDPVDLVLVNRVLEHGGDGLEVIRALKADARWSAVPVMLVSNYPEYQDVAVQAGAVRGFGKNSLYHRATVDLLARYLLPAGA